MARDQERVVARGQLFLWAVERLQRLASEAGEYVLRCLNISCRWLLVCVQRHWRGYQSRSLAATVARWCAVCEIQHHVRVHLLRRNSATRIIQRNFERYRTVREAVAAQRRSIVLVQAVWRGSRTSRSGTEMA